MRCLAMHCCSCCLAMAGSWNEATEVLLSRLWSRPSRRGCWSSSLIRWSSFGCFRCSSGSFGASQSRTCWRWTSCCCLEAAGIFSVCGCWLCCCCCHSGCRLWWGSCCRQDLRKRTNLLIRNKESIQGCHSLNFPRSSWEETLKVAQHWMATSWLWEVSEEDCEVDKESSFFVLSKQKLQLRVERLQSFPFFSLVQHSRRDLCFEVIYRRRNCQPSELTKVPSRIRWGKCDETDASDQTFCNWANVETFQPKNNLPRSFAASCRDEQ